MCSQAHSRFRVMEENYTLPCGSQTIHTTVTATPGVVRRWVHNIRHRHRFHRYRGRLVVGLGVQWTPQYGAAAATIQLCVGHKCLIFQLIHADKCPAILRRFLMDTDVIFVGLWNHSDAAMLMRSQHDLEVGRVVDVREVAGRNVSTGTLAAEILGVHGMDKLEYVGRSDWEVEQLSMEQVMYACHDVFLAFSMAMELRVWNWKG